MHEAQGRGEEAAPEHEDPGVDLVDLELVGSGIPVLDDASDPIVLAHPHDAAVAGGVGEAGGEDGARGAGVAVLGDEGGDGGGAEQRRVTREHEDVEVVVQVVVGKAGEAHADGVTGAALHLLLDEFEPQAGVVLGELLGDALGAVAHDHHGPVDLRRREGVEHVEHHRPAAEQVERLRPGRPHPRALARRQDDCREVPIRHANRSTAPAPSELATMPGQVRPGIVASSGWGWGWGWG